jgi:hypothetical protein
LQSDHSGMFVDLRMEGIFGQRLDKLAPHKFRNLKLDDPRISDKHRKILHKQFENHNVYRRVKKISLRGKDSPCNLEDESVYKNLDEDISEAMKHADRMYNIKKSHATPWKKSLGQETHSIHYWDARIISRDIRNNDDAVLNYYLLRSNVDKERFDTTMTLMSCIHQLKNSRSQIKDILKDAKSNSSFYEKEVATARVEKKYPHLTEDNPAFAIEREEKIELEIKARENRWNTPGSFRNLGHQIQGRVKPNKAKKCSLKRVTVPDSGPEGFCKHIICTYDLEDNFIERNFQQFSHAGATPFDYTDMGKELGQKGDYLMAQDIFEGTLKHAAF